MNVKQITIVLFFLLSTLNTTAMLQSFGSRPLAHRQSLNLNAQLKTPQKRFYSQSKKQKHVPSQVKQGVDQTPLLAGITQEIKSEISNIVNLGVRTAKSGFTTLKSEIKTTNPKTIAVSVPFGLFSIAAGSFIGGAYSWIAYDLHESFIEGCNHWEKSGKDSTEEAWVLTGVTLGGIAGGTAGSYGIAGLPGIAALAATSTALLLYRQIVSTRRKNDIKSCTTIEQL